MKRGEMIYPRYIHAQLLATLHSAIHKLLTTQIFLKSIFVTSRESQNMGPKVADNLKKKYKQYSVVPTKQEIKNRSVADNFDYDSVSHIK